MGISRRYMKDRRIGFFLGYRDKVEKFAPSGASASGTLIPYGTSVITSTGSGIHKFKLPAPPGTGVRKTIIVLQKNTAAVHVRTQTTGSSFTFFGSTDNVMVFSTKVKGLGCVVNLVGVSTKQWALAEPVRTSGSTKTDTQPSPITAKVSTW